MKSAVPASAGSVYQGPRIPGSTPSASKYQIAARATMITTTTSDMTVSWKIANGKNGFLPS